MAAIHVKKEADLARLGVKLDPADPTQAIPLGHAGPDRQGEGEPGPKERASSGAPSERARHAGEAAMGQEAQVPPEAQKILRDLFPPLERHQRDALRRKIEAGEVKPRVVVWRGTGLVVDGRETRRICEELGRGYQAEEREFEDLEAVVCWRITEQLTEQLLHRNLTRVATSYYRGRHYNALKRQGRRPDEIFRQTGEIRTAKLLGQLYRVGQRTIERDGELCEALDSIAEKNAEELLDPLFNDGFVLGAEYRSGVLTGRIRPTHDEVLGLSRMRLDEMARAIRDRLEAEKKKPRRKAVPPTPDPTPPKAAPPTPDPTPPKAAPPGPPTTPPDPALPPGPRDDSEAIDEAGLKETNEVYGKLNPATQKAFLRQDHVSKRACEAGFVRTVNSGTEGGTA